MNTLIRIPFVYALGSNVRIRHSKMQSPLKLIVNPYDQHLHFLVDNNIVNIRNKIKPID